MTKVTKPLPHLGGSFIRDKKGELKPRPADPAPLAATTTGAVEEKVATNTQKPPVKEA